MSILASGTIEHHICEVCGAKVTQLRRGRCISCYNKWVESQPVPVGASCRICGERRRENIQRTELLGRWYNLCHTCAYRSTRLSPMPHHIEGIKMALERNRRFGDRRLGDEDERRIKRERRVGERRVIFLEESDLLWDDDDLYLDYDEPIEGEVTGVFQKFDRKSLETDSPEDLQLEI
ncbi:MAG: hypothetical protein JXR95_13920 [Deltaproteobacteria bacterium]|nr:hypothetical protein [Deltaproteobacteria bacterium]